MADKPLIGIPCNDVKKDSKVSWVYNLTTRSTYVDAVWAGGGIPVVIPPLVDLSSVNHFVKLCQGFIFPGGPDLNPAHYGQEQHPKTQLVDPRREAFDLEFMGQVVHACKPWLAICMGCQAMNVVLGGDLIQDIEDLVPGAENHTSKRDGGADEPPRHKARILSGTKLHSLVDTEELLVNTSHHQAVGRLSDQACPSAYSSNDDILEAWELPDHPFAIAVQWHPEWLINEPAHKNLFSGLVSAAQLLCE
jgi:putative glutamine amidotransferase